MKYPYIGKSKKTELTILFTSENKGICISISDVKHIEWYENEFTNITREYLANTYGEVKSKEHAEFIVKLAEGAGLSECGSHFAPDLFCFSKHNLFLYEPGSLNEAKGKLITIPLPPKEPEPKCWPQVGDEVVTASKLDATVIAIDNCEAWVKYKGKPTTKGYGSVAIATLSKPPTPEEELAKELVNKLQADQGVKINNEKLCALKVISRVIVNGRIKGLSYKPE